MVGRKKNSHGYKVEKNHLPRRALILYCVRNLHACDMFYRKRFTTCGGRRPVCVMCSLSGNIYGISKSIIQRHKRHKLCRLNWTAPHHVCSFGFTCGPLGERRWIPLHRYKSPNETSSVSSVQSKRTQVLFQTPMQQEKTTVLLR